MKRKIPFIVLCNPLFFLVACVSDSQKEKESSPSSVNGSAEEKADSKENYATRGYIVEKNETKIWVIPEIQRGELMGKNKEALDALLKGKYEGKGYNFDLNAISEKTISSLYVGQKVVVARDELGFSAPISGGTALKIKIVEE